MLRPKQSARLWAWTFVCLLILKAAVPFFAVQAASLQGVPVAEVCPMYGVHVAQAGHGDHALHDHHAAHSGTPHDGTAAHADDHCALAAIASMAVPDALQIPIAAAGAVEIGAAVPIGQSYPDACADWASRLRHAPPAFA